MEFRNQSTCFWKVINPNLGVGGRVLLMPIWFSLINSKTVKDVILDIGQKLDVGISDFRISGQSLIKENCHNSRTSDNIDMKLGPVTKLDKRNKTTSKKSDNDVMSKHCDIIAIFRILGQFGAVRRPDSGHRVCKSYFFSNSNLLSYKNWKQN